MAFEKFIAPKKKGFAPKLSIRRGAQIGVNYGAVEKFGLEKYEYAMLYYDKENKRIGIKPSKEKEKGTLRLRIKDKSGSISARSFLEYYSIDYKSKHSYPARFEEEPFELLRPLLDLATKKTIVDLGCGSGFYTFSGS